MPYDFEKKKIEEDLSSVKSDFTSTMNSNTDIVVEENINKELVKICPEDSLVEREELGLEKIDRLEEEKRKEELKILEQERIDIEKRDAEIKRLEQARINEEKKEAELKRLEQARIDEEKRQAEL